MSPRAHLLLLVLPLLAAAPLAVLALAELPEFGASLPAYGERLAGIIVEERRSANLVAAVVFDYRGFDTLCEQFIVFGAVIAVALLFRDVQSLPEGGTLRAGILPRREVRRSEGTTAAARAGLAVILVYGVHVALHGHLTPGGGFQGGTIIAGALLLIYIGDGHGLWRRATQPAALDVAKALSAVAYALIGTAGLLLGGAFLENVLPLGRTGDLLSSGTIALLNATVGLGVAAGMALLFHEFLGEVEAAEDGDA